jgi:hypothetical protein
MQNLLIGVLVALLGSSGCAESNPQPSPAEGADQTGQKQDTADGVSCPFAIPVECGSSFSHSTVVQGRDNEWSGYSCSARLMSGREVLYRFQAGQQGPVTIALSNLSADLDLFLLTQCDASTCIENASRPADIQDVESLTFLARPGETYFVSVDGYADAEGTYDFQVSCQQGGVPATFGGGTWEFQVDRHLASPPGSATFPSDPLSEEDYVPVDGTSPYPVFVPESGSWVSIGDPAYHGTLAQGPEDKVTFQLSSGTFAGGRFVVWTGPLGLQAELTIYGSGVPIVSSQRGALVLGR